MTSSWYSSNSALSSQRRGVSDGMAISIPSYAAPLTFSNIGRRPKLSSPHQEQKYLIFIWLTLLDALTVFHRPQQRILLTVIERIADAERTQVLVRQNILLAVEGGALRHEGTGHCPS